MNTSPSAATSPTMTVDETAALLGISRGLAFLAVRTGELPSIRIGRRILIPRQRLLDMINNPTAQASAETPGDAPSGSATGATSRPVLER